MTEPVIPERPDTEIWADEAHAVLKTVAAGYGGIITSRDLGAQVQERSGITTRSLLQNWINPVLNTVRDRCQDAGDPPLTALVVNKTDGRVGAGFDSVLAARGLPEPVDSDERDQHAAQSRQECYRHYGDKVPDGARPMLSPTLQARVDKERKLRKSLEQAPRCQTCNVELSRTGRCDSCDN